MENEMTQKLNWEVELRPINYAGKKNTDRYALVRTDTEKLIGIRSKNYHPVYNRDLELIKDKILKVGGFNFKGYQEFSGGKRILSFYENKRNDLTLCGQEVKDYLIIGNSHDTSSKLFVSTSNYMFRCENQFSEKIRSFEKRHNRPFNINEIRIEEIIQSYDEGRRNLYLKMERLKDVQVDMKLIQQLAIQLLGTESRKEQVSDIPQLKNSKQTILFLKCIEEEILDLGPTLWGVFNGVTRYTSNHLKGKPGFGVVNGKGEEMNKKAMALLYENVNE